MLFMVFEYERPGFVCSICSRLFNFHPIYGEGLSFSNIPKKEE